MQPTTIHTKKGTLKLIEPGIVKLTLKENITWTLEDAKETHEANLKLTNSGKYCVYFLGSRFFIPTQEAQQYAISKECTDHRVAVAFVPKKLGLLLFANLFMKTFKSKSPSKVFKSEDAALKWLRETYKKSVTE